MYILVNKKEFHDLIKIKEGKAVTIKDMGTSKILEVENLSDGTILFSKTDSMFSGLYLYRNFLFFFAQKENKHLGIDLDNKRTIFKADLNLLNLEIDDKNVQFPYYYGNSFPKGFIKFDLSKGEIVHIIDATVQKKKYILFENFQISVEKQNGVIKLLKAEHLIWSKDFSETHASNDVFFGKRKGEVFDAMVWGEDILILTGTKLLHLSQGTGQIISETEIGLRITAYFLVFQEKIFILGSDVVGYLIYDPVQKKISMNIKLEGFLENDKQFGLSASNWCINEEYLWFASNHYGGYIGAVEPFTGKRIECIIPESNLLPLSKPQFYNNKIFIKDTSGILSTYENI